MPSFNNKRLDQDSTHPIPLKEVTGGQLVVDENEISEIEKSETWKKLGPAIIKEDEI